MDTRFGLMEFNDEHAIYMPRGMMGFADKKNFGLARIPDPRMENFLFLQNLADQELSFQSHCVVDPNEAGVPGLHPQESPAYPAGRAALRGTDPRYGGGSPRPSP